MRLIEWSETIFFGLASDPRYNSWSEAFHNLPFKDYKLPFYVKFNVHVFINYTINV